MADAAARLVPDAGYRAHALDGDFARQAAMARRLGSPFVAAVIEAGARQLRHAPLTRRLMADWPRPPAADALVLRFNAALHALARRGTPAALAACYPADCRHCEQPLDAAVRQALADHDAFIAGWLHATPQTNEVGRAGAVMAALMTVHDRFGMPFELLELGASCGLNLNLARYAHDLGGVSAGVAGAPVRIAPAWRGAAPPAAPVAVIAARGVDLDPIDPGDAAARERLLAYVWADQPARAERLLAALEIARHHPPQVARGSALHWLRAQLAMPQAGGTCRVVLHSMVLQYLAPAERHAVEAAIDAAGAHATADRPLARIGFEWDHPRQTVELQLVTWPDGRRRRLATCHAYGEWLDWQG